MKNVLGIILNVDGEDTTLKSFLEHRTLSTLPFGGRYRLIDFTLSNMVNSGIKKVGVVGSNKFNSLVDHLGTGKEWSLSRKTQDLTILNGLSNTRIGGLIKINLRNLQNNRAFLEGIPVDHVLITTPNLVTSYNFKEAFDEHVLKDSDVTMLYKKDDPAYILLGNDVYLDLDEDRVTDLFYKNERKTQHFFSEMLLIKKDLLLQFLDFSERSGDWDLMDMIQDNINLLKIRGIEHKGYLKRINNLSSYVEVNNDLLDYETIQKLFLDENPIYTKIKDNHPTLYSPSSQVVSSIVGSGCVIDGDINQSVIFRDTTVMKNAHIENCISMQHCYIGRNVTLKYVVMDKQTVISDNTSLIGKPHSPIVLKKGTVI